MNTQTFHAPNVMMALEEIQEKMGPDAVVVSVRQVPSGPSWQVWREPEVEVVAMQTAPATNTASIPGRAPQTMKSPITAKHTSAQPSKEVIAWNFPARTNQSDPTPKTIEPSPLMQKSAPELSPELEKFKGHLLGQGVNTGLVDKFVRICLETLNPRSLRDEDRLREFISHQMIAHLREFQGVERRNARLICLIGPNGSGKTSVCAKLAAKNNHNSGGKASWVCTDTVSAGAISQARVLTDALGIPLHKIYSVEDLTALVQEDRTSDLVLVDTPGCNPYKEASIVELGELLSALPERATYLVVSANSKDEDLSKALNTFRPFNLDGLIITHLDETGSFGNVFNLAWRSHLPIIYFSDDPRLPGNLRDAQSDILVEALVNGLWK